MIVEMSWSVIVVPAGIPGAHELLDAPVRPGEPVPQVADVLAVIRDSGFCGGSCFAVDGVDVGDWLSGWDPAHVDNYIGEVSIYPVGAAGEMLLTLTAPFEFIWLHKPYPQAALSMICELARVSGSSLIVGETGALGHWFLVLPGDRPADHAYRWFE